MENDLDFSSFFNEKLRDKGLSLKKLSEATGISLTHLQKLSEGDFRNLPPAPYLRGYLSRIGKVLDFDPEIWWQYFQEQEEVKQSGTKDKLPGNRFAVKPLSKYFWAIGIGVLVLVYLVVRFSAILGKPSLNVAYPMDAVTTVENETLTVKGSTDGDELLVYSEPVSIGQDGNWEKDIQLNSGLNTIEITAKKFLGRETKVVRQVVYEAPKNSKGKGSSGPATSTEQEATSTSSSTKATSTNSD